MKFPEPFYRWRPHPWHGVDVGPKPPEIVHAYIEITPFDSVKYEVDKATGYLRVDRPQRSSSQPPALYGFVPRTFCGPRVCALSEEAEQGDGDPLDICVISERPIDRAEILLNARVIGGLQMVDGGEADDKLVAILQNDHMWGHVNDIGELPEILIERLQHYFLTYKQIPSERGVSKVKITSIFGKEHAHKLVKASMDDYDEMFGG